MLRKSASYLVAAARYRDRASTTWHFTVAEFRAHTCSELGLDPALLAHWLELLGFADWKLLPVFVCDVMDRPGLHALRAADSGKNPCVLVNTSDQETGFGCIIMPPHTLAVHPGEKSGVAVGWVSPIHGVVQIKGRWEDGHPTCGDGVEWKLQICKEGCSTSVATGVIPNGGQNQLGEGIDAEQIERVAVQPGDIVLLTVQ